MNGIAAYRNYRARSASNEVAVGLLYREALRRVDLATSPEGRVAHLHHARSILLELRDALDPKGSVELVTRLRSLYDFCLVELGRAHRSPERLDYVRKVLLPLADGWDDMLAHRGVTS